MNWVGHTFVAGILTLIGIMVVFTVLDYPINQDSIIRTVLFSGTALLASIAPDFDTPKSKFAKLIEFIVLVLAGLLSFLIFGATIWAGVSFIVMFAIFKLVYALFVPSHRGFIHSIFFLVLATAVLYYLTHNIYIAGGFVWGFGLHLLVDGCGLKLW